MIFGGGDWYVLRTEKLSWASKFQEKRANPTCWHA